MFSVSGVDRVGLFTICVKLWSSDISINCSPMVVSCVLDTAEESSQFMSGRLKSPATHT